MKKTLLLLTIAFGVSHSAWAAGCISGDNLAQYITAGSCTYGDLTFSFSTLSYIPSGSPLITASDVTVNTTTVGAEEGLIFNAPWSVLNGQITDSEISFLVTCNGCNLDDWALQMSGEGSGGDGYVNVSETSPEIARGLTQSSVGGVLTGVGSGTFSPMNSISVNKDILINGGDVAFTSTQVSSVTNLFSTTSTAPEPSLLILCAGILGLVPFARRKFVH